ncbi:hypothetical protein GCM10029992_53160 [Glycomyces albus]
MSYPPQNPYDPNQQPGFGQPSPQQPRHFTTDSDPYSRPDPYGQNPYSGAPQMSVQPGSVPPNTPPGPPPPPGFQTGQAFQPGQPAPAPPRGSSNTPLMVTILVIVVALAIGGTVIATLISGDDGDTDIADDPTGEATTAAEETTEPSPEPTEEETTDGYEAEYRTPEVDECIENVTDGFYVVPCDAEEAYWLVLHIEQNPDDPDPDDPMHNTAGHNACKDYDYTLFYYTDTALLAGRDWDPEVDSITAIYCVREVDG